MAINIFCNECDFSVTVHTPNMIPNVEEVHTSDTGHINFGVRAA